MDLAHTNTKSESVDFCVRCVYQFRHSRFFKFFKDYNGFISLIKKDPTNNNFDPLFPKLNPNSRTTKQDKIKVLLKLNH